MKKNNLAIMLSGASALMIATSVHAQEARKGAAEQAANGTETSTGNEIVVTARRRAENLLDVPQTVDVVTDQSLKELNLTKFEDVTAVVPGLALSQNGGVGFRSTLRGVGFDSIGGAAPNVAFYINDASVSPFSLFQSLYDIGQIEVLRGPQGTLRGKASPSGSITVTTRKPDLSEVGGSIQMSGTEKGAIAAQAGISLPVITDVLAIRLAGSVDHNDGTRVRPLTSAPSPYSRTESGRASIRFEPSDFIDANVMYQYLQRKVASYTQVESTSLSQPGTPVRFGGNTLIRARERRAVSITPGLIDEKQHLLTGNVNLHFGGQQLSYVGSYFDLNQNTQQAQDTGNIFPSQRIAQRVTTAATQETHELRLASEERLFGFLDYTIGGFYAKLKGDNVVAQPNILAFNFGFPFFAAQFDLPLLAQTPQTEKSAFGNLTAHFGRTEISGGLRYIEIKDDNTVQLDLNTLVGPGAGLLDIQPSNPRKFTNTIYNLSIKQELSDNLIVYANTGTSFRTNAPLIGVNRPLTQGLLQFVNLAPEKSTSYELGVKGSLLDNRLDFSFAAFHQKFDGFLFRNDQPVTYISLANPAGSQTDPTNFRAAQQNFLANVPAKVNGFEAQITYRPTDRFYIDTQLAYARGKIKNGVIACNDANGDGVPDSGGLDPTTGQIFASSGGNAISSCTVNQRLSNQPNWTLNVQSEYSMPVFNDGEAFVRGLLTYRPNNPNVPTNRFDDVKSHGLLNLYAGLRSEDGAWEVSLFAKNITNTYRTLSRGQTPLTTNTSANANPPIPANVFPSNYVEVTSTAPREFGLSLRYAFGSR